SSSLLDQLSGYRSALDQHPILHAGLAFALLLVGAQILGRVARYIVLYAANQLARQPPQHWLGDLIRNNVFQRLAQTTPTLLVQF
ncbi:mechanosensitive ion channel family protein, partial [Pseudomonas aeruginosa]